MTNPPQEEQLEQWIHPVTGERAQLNLGGQGTVVEFGGQRVTHLAPPFDLAAEKEKLRRETEQNWHPMIVHSWFRNLESQFGSPEAARQHFLGLGFPEALWDELLHFKEQEAQARLGRTHRLPLPAESLLDQPDIRRRFAAVWAEAVQIVPPSPDTTLRGGQAALRERGFLRVTARRPDGSLWLPPALEGDRPALEASERPVLRLAADPGRTPKPWESQVGGTPYRRLGSPWPVSREDEPRPLVFLAQLNFAEINPEGRALPDFPSTGLLQFFILNADFYGAELSFDWTDDTGFRVLYLPDVVEDVTKLDRSVPPISVPDDLWFELPFDPPHHAYDQRPWPVPAVALRAVPDREPISGADEGRAALLGLPAQVWDDEAASAKVSALYALSPGGHKVGGFPDFTQPDPRNDSERGWPLLLQLDSDPSLNLLWGDRGTANFFIRPEDLEKLDFSRVAYHWDCG